jgi:hypothetical protein
LRRPQRRVTVGEDLLRECPKIGEMIASFKMNRKHPAY